MTINQLGDVQSVAKRALAQKAKHASTAAVAIALTIGTAMLPGAARATLQTGTFAGTLNNDPSSDFTSNGFTSSAGDAITGDFSFDGSNVPGTFTATIFDVTSGDSFTLPAGFASTASVTASGTDYNVSAVYPLEFLPTFTPFTATLLLDLNGASLVPGDIGQTALFTGATGSLEINIPTAPGGPVDQTIGFTIDSASIPEPATIGLFSLALAGLARARRRAKR
jgi:hypothetical protein